MVKTITEDEATLNFKKNKNKMSKTKEPKKYKLEETDIDGCFDCNSECKISFKSRRIKDDKIKEEKVRK
jgi:hypothetical protein